MPDCARNDGVGLRSRISGCYSVTKLQHGITLLRHWVDTHWDRGMSYLKIGWSWLRQQFRRGWPVLPPFWLDAEPDPEPAVASRRQAARPGPKWRTIFNC